MCASLHVSSFFVRPVSLFCRRMDMFQLAIIRAYCIGLLLLNMQYLKSLECKECGYEKPNQSKWLMVQISYLMKSVSQYVLDEENAHIAKANKNNV